MSENKGYIEFMKWLRTTIKCDTSVSSSPYFQKYSDNEQKFDRIIATYKECMLEYNKENVEIDFYKLKGIYESIIDIKLEEAEDAIRNYDLLHNDSLSKAKKFYIFKNHIKDIDFDISVASRKVFELESVKEKVKKFNDSEI